MHRFVDHCFSSWFFSFGHYIVCRSSIDCYWLPLNFCKLF